MSETPRPGSFADKLLELDQARNARPRIAQLPSEMVRERDARLASQADKIAALRKARESRPVAVISKGVSMPKRELIDTGTDKRYVRRNKRGTSFVESDDVGRSLATDRRRHAKTKVKSGEGDKGDRPRPKTARKSAKSKAATRKPARRKSAARKPAARKKSAARKK
jgi:hypothetical protein